jgi:carbonic anhydrase
MNKLAAMNLFMSGDHYSFNLFCLGPSTWDKGFPIANGQRQSPIDIRTKACQIDNHLSAKPFHVNYSTEKDVEVSNTGSSIKVQIKEVSGKRPIPIKTKILKHLTNCFKDITCLHNKNVLVGFVFRVEWWSP